MALLAIRNVRHAFGGPPVLDDACLQVEPGDRVCLFGRNGEGKSTLLRIVAGAMKPDGGVVDLAKGSSLGCLEQDVPDREDRTVREVVVDGLGEVRDTLNGYQAAIDAVSKDPSEANLSRLDKAQQALEAVDGWDIQQRVDVTLTKLGLDGGAVLAELSGGWRRRVFLARALVSSPDVLLLDEPTNHLDIEAIEWLEGLLQRHNGAIIFVSHDRSFLRNVATRLVELDRGRLVEYPASYDDYRDAKAHALGVENEHHKQFDKKLALEEAWIRTGIKARRTRNEGRVRALKDLRNQRSERRTRKGTADFSIQAADKSGALVTEAKNLTFAYGDNRIVTGLDVIVKRGDRIGLIGPNGVGKTTVLRILLGQLEPDAGTVHVGTRLQVAYFDQLRAQLDPDKTVAETIVEKGDTVEVGDRKLHIVGYLREFLFTDAQARMPVSVLSGGERNRLLLAKLFAQPCNVLVLDEPTNDLDVETLELLESLLLGFSGTVLLVSHDREFLDNVVTDSLIFEGQGKVTRLVGGYADWLEVRAEQREMEAAEREREKNAKVSPKRAPAKKAKTLSHKLQRELDGLPAVLEKIERQQAEVHKKLADPTLYKDRPDEVPALQSQVARLDAELEVAFGRWEELESMQ